MNLKKKIVLNLACVLALLTAMDVKAADNEVIYKIHDIKPQKQDNEVVGCEFSATFFNRSNFLISNLSIDIGWTDEVIADKIIQEKKELKTNYRTGDTGYNTQSKTETFTSKTISTNLSIPPMAVSKQISVKGVVKSDRCFLLMEKPQVIVRSCKMGNNSASDDKTAGLCKDLFTFVSPKDAQYYSDFKAVSYQTAKNMEERRNMDEKKDLDNVYGKAVSSVKRISATLKTMQ